MLVQVEKLLAAGGIEMAIRADVSVERLQVFEALVLSHFEHVAFNLGNLLQPGLMNLIGGQVRGGHRADSKGIAGRAIG